jgi:hypothetical protein
VYPVPSEFITYDKDISETDREGLTQLPLVLAEILLARLALL